MVKHTLSVCFTFHYCYIPVYVHVYTDMTYIAIIMVKCTVLYELQIHIMITLSGSCNLLVANDSSVEVNVI